MRFLELFKRPDKVVQPKSDDTLPRQFAEVRGLAEAGLDSYANSRDKLLAREDTHAFFQQWVEKLGKAGNDFIDVEIVAAGFPVYVARVLNPLWAMNAVTRLFLQLNNAANQGNPEFEALHQAFVTNADLMTAAVNNEAIQDMIGEESIIPYLNTTLANQWKTQAGIREEVAKADARQNEIAGMKQIFLRIIEMTETGEPGYPELRKQLDGEEAQDLLMDSERAVKALQGTSLPEYLATLDKTYWPRRAEKLLPEMLGNDGPILDLWQEIFEPWTQGWIQLNGAQLKNFRLKLVTAYLQEHLPAIEKANTFITKDSHKTYPRNNGYEEWEDWVYELDGPGTDMNKVGRLQNGCKTYLEEIKTVYQIMENIARETASLVTPKDMDLRHEVFAEEAAKMSPPYEPITAGHIETAQAEILFIAEQFRQMDEQGKCRLHGKPVPARNLQKTYGP